MIGDRANPCSLQRIRREALIQLGLGILALGAAVMGTFWLFQGRLHRSVWLGVAGALTLAVIFLLEGRRARGEYSSESPHGAAKDVQLDPLGALHRRRVLGGMVFGIIAAIGGPGVNVLIRIVSRGGAGAADLLAWLIFTFPISLAVWTLPPRGLGRRRG